MENINKTSSVSETSQDLEQAEKNIENQQAEATPVSRMSYRELLSNKEWQE